MSGNYKGTGKLLPMELLDLGFHLFCVGLHRLWALLGEDAADGVSAGGALKAADQVLSHSYCVLQRN